MNKFDKKDLDDCPSMEEMFKIGDKIKNQKKYTTKELVDLIHVGRRKNMAMK